MALEGLHHITAITADAPAQRRLLRARAGPAPGEEDGQLRPARRLPPVLRRRARRARLDPDLLRVPRRRAGPGRRRHGPHHPVARRVRGRARLLGGPPGRRGRRHRAHRGRRRWPSPTSRACATSCSPSRVDDAPLAAHAADIPAEHALLGFHGVRAYAARPDASTALLEAIGFASRRRRRLDAARRRAPRGAALRRPAGRSAASRAPGPSTTSPGRPPTTPSSRPSARRPSQAGARATEIIDRQYFHSVYFREPSGVLFELASRDIGFEYDEPLESLGEALRLPPQYEAGASSSSRR